MGRNWKNLIMGKLLPMFGAGVTVFLSLSAVAYAGNGGGGGHHDGKPTPIPEVPYSAVLPGGLAAITYIVYKMRNRSE